MGIRRIRLIDGVEYDSRVPLKMDTPFTSWAVKEAPSSAARGGFA